MPKERAQESKDTLSIPNDNARKAIEELAQKTAVIKKEVSTGVSLTNDGLKSLDTEANEVKQSIDNELTQFNNTVSWFKQKASNARRDIIQSATSFVSSINETKETLEDYSLIVFAIALIALVAWEIGSWINTQSFTLDPAFFALIILILGITASVNLTLKYTHKKFSAYQDRIMKETKQVMDETLNAFGEPLEFHTNTKGLKNKLTTVISDFNKALTAVGHFVPEYTNYYDLKNKVHSLSIFTQTLRNALSNFGIILDEKSDTDLRDYFPREIGEGEWLEDISKKLSIKIGIPSELVELAYYEYTDNTQGKSNQWSRILGKPELLTDLIRLLCREPIVDVSYLNVTEAAESPSVQLIIAQMPTFSIEEFRKTYYSFYNDLADQKRQLLASLYDFDIKLGETEHKSIVSFVPKKERSLWMEELIQRTAETTGIQKGTLALIYFEKKGNDTKTNEVWAEVRKQSINEYIQFLTKQQRFVVPQYYRENDAFGDYLKRSLLTDTGGYSYDRLTEKILRNLSNLDGKKKILLQAVEHYGCSLSEEERQEFQGFLPTEGNEQETLIQYISGKTGTSLNIVQLFYYGYVQKEFEEKRLFKEIRDAPNSDELLKLSELLLDKKKIQLPIGEKNVGSAEVLAVLKTMARLNIIETQLLLNKYISMRNYLLQLSDFTATENLAVEDTDLSLSFTDLIRITTNSSPEADILLHLDTLLSYMVDNKSGWISNYKEHMSEIVVAALALFLWRIRDNNRGGACQKAAEFELSSKILYQYQMLNENTIGRQTVRLRSVVEDVVCNRLAGYECLTEFTLNLKHGLLVSGRQELFTASIREIKHKISGEIKEYQEALTELQSDVRDIFKTQLDSDVTELFLNSNLISAYLITTNQRSQVITGIIDNTLKDCCKELAKTDRTYKDFLLLEDESKSVGGYYTRTGLVPLSMSFKEFSGHFEKIFNKAKDEYKKQHPDPTKNYSVNLLRILPSDIAFKAILDTSNEKIDTLIETVGSLIVEKLSVIDTFEFLTSLSGTEPKAEIQDLVETAIDHHTSIYSLINADISGIITSQRITELLKSRDFDKKLMGKYNCKSLSSFAVAIHRINIDTNKAQDTLYTNLLEVIGEKDNSDKSEISAISITFFRKLERIGKVLSL